MTANDREPPDAARDGAVTVVGASAPPRTKAAFLAAYARGGNVSEAATAAGIKRQAHQMWLQDDHLYRRRFAAACQDARDALEAEARRRALHGVEEDVYHEGRVVGTRRVYSDALLMFLLARVPSDGSSPGPDHCVPPPDLHLQAEIDDLLTRLPANGHR